MNPLYTEQNCKAAYQLQWALSLFWRNPQEDVSWLDALREAVEPDGVRVRSHRFAGERTSQFHLSTTPAVAPTQFARSVKGRLQYLIRGRVPKAFQRNYGFRSVGTVKREVIESYVQDQLGHHRMADERVQERLAKYQIVQPEVDLTLPRQSAHARYWYNLHVVFVTEARWMEIRDETLRGLRTMILNAARKRNHLLSRAGIIPDHVHLVLGCTLEESPEEVALSYMNNLAYACGMKPVFRSSYYVGTFGEYDTGVL